ncbi:hypothetical protein D3C71_1878360 [compost metagenome]
MALADGNLADVSRSLMVAFSAVILALLAAAISYSVVNVRKRWYATDLAAIEQGVAPLESPAQDMLGHLVSEVPA